MRALVRGLAVLITFGILSAGCSFLIEGQEEGRPCKEGRCPFGFLCVDQQCVRPENGTNGQETCAAVTDCSCEDETIPVCGDDQKCRCMMLQGRIDGVGPEAGSGRFRVTGGRLGHANCVSGSDPNFVLCGGFTQ